MFATNMDSARDVGGAPSTVLIPMRFVWPYGGRSVFLSGSFARRWSELIPMTPVEGCPTVFQAIYSVTPGYHQYKFFVDGEWRHDEHQPFVSGEYGLVNTILLATDPNLFHPNVTPEITSGPNYMEEDNEAFRRLVRITDGTLTDVVPRISEVDLQSSRHRISVFLSTHTTYELLPESGKVVALDVDLPVKKAFHILHEQGIPLAPLWDFSNGRFVGVISALDFILILRELGNHGSNLTEEELETHTIAAWKEGKAYLNGQVNGHGRAVPRQLVHAGPYDNMKDVVLKILQNGFATVPIIHSSSEDGSFPQLLHLASLSGILKCVCRYFRHSSSSLPILQAPIRALNVGTWVPEIVNEKSNGGRLTTSMRNFNDFIRETELKDLELLNAQFTWSNFREEPVCRRLDRFLFSAGCEEIFPEVRQMALARVISDHCPIQLESNKVKWGPSPFRFENMWLQHPEFRNKFNLWWQSEQVEGWEGYKFMIKLKAIKKKVQRWSKESFGEVEKDFKEAEASLEELDRREGMEGLDVDARRKREELLFLVGDLAYKEEVKWRQRSKVEWAKEGDGNTKFFHRVASGRRKRNYIERLETEVGGVIEDANEIEEHIVNFFKSLFSSNEEACWGLEGINWAPISELEANWIERPFEEAEVQRAVFDCGKDKSPGPDGYSLQMIQQCWDILKANIMKIMEEFYETGIINAVTNETFICLIPKKSDSMKVTDFRPISLVTGLYKIMAKTLASRLKEVLGSTISQNQGAFVKDRQILDAVLIANEVVEEVRQKKEEGLVLKIDFEKAYDHVEWRFLDEVLQRKSFGNRWRKWMQGCLSSANFSVLINGRPRGKFQASRGLRQGDPLSPFLFTLVVDVLSRLMEKAQENHLIKGLCIGQEEVEISHLQFADDTIFFLAEDEGGWNNLLELLKLFCSVSGLKINKAKCYLAGINSDCEKLNRLADSWGCEVGSWPIKYLGLPLGGRPRALKFWDPVVEKMEKRLQSWKKAFLSRGGRLTLIQSVLGSLPTYYMSLFKMPCGVIGRLEKLMKGFLWEGVEEGKKNNLVKWEIVIKSKEEGGLGVGNLRNRNEALLAKWLWRFPKEPHSLWHKVIRSKYGLQNNGWNAFPPIRGSSRSPWKDISSGSQLFLHCCKFEVGNGERVRFWEEGWLDGGPLKEQFPRLFLLSRKHNQNISSFVDLSTNSLSWNFEFRRSLNEAEIEEAARLLQKVEEVRLSQSRTDNRRWKMEASGLFTCKSYCSFLSNNGMMQYFPPHSQIWKSKVPPKVKILVWLAAKGKLNTCDQIQRRSPFICLSPQWCSLCKAKEESVNHIFLHCSYTIQLWWKLFQEVRASWVIPKGCFELLSTKFQALGSGRKAKALWGCLVSAVFWNIWLERNKRIFEDYTAQVSSIPIVDDTNSLLDIYCRSDITALAKDRAYAHINLNEMSIQQALQLGQDSFSPYKPRGQRCQMCLRSDSLHKVMERLANPGVRRLVIVEAGSKRVEGIVSLSDVFKFLLG